jgi:FtsP/CotA-like multicopper oxidase with cupredoxin domain
MLDGSNARFYNVWLQNLATGSMGPAIVQVGVDGGLLDTPVRLDPNLGQKLLLAPGERGDIIIDFSNIAPGTVLTLMNDANAPYPSGDPVEVGTTDRIMQFVVNGQMVNKANHTKHGMDRSQIPDRLRKVPIVKLTDFLGRPAVKADIIRQLTLNEVEGEEGPAMALINNSRYTDMPEMGMFGALTEDPVEGTTEIWQLINLTMDAHPIHLHLVQFQLVSRQDFDMEQYMTDYENSFTGVNGGMSGMLMGAEGPPFQYKLKNADGAIGGNLPVTPYLLGSPILPDANERGWKDVIKVYPNQVLTFIVRFAPTDLPAFLPKAFLRYGFDPAKGPGYVWHCHILEHEDNDMMRPMSVTSNPWRVREPELLALDTTIFKSTLPGSGQTSLATDLRPYTLEQNYPNPFRTETEIRFSIPEAGHIQLKLYNYMGMVVNTLIDAEAPSGNQSVILSADNLANGIYFYQLRAGDFIETKKLIVSK